MKTWRFFWRLMLFRPWPFWINCTCITVLFVIEMVPGFVARAFFNRLSSIAFGMSVRDLNCSFKLFRGDLLRSLPLESADFFIDTEMVARIHRGGWRYVQRGVRHFPRTAGRSTVRASDVPRTLVAIARFWLRLRARHASRVTA